MQSYMITYPSSFSQLNSILFVADNDDDPPVRFNALCEQVRLLFGSSSVPTSDRHSAGGEPRIHILMLPNGGLVGHLERTCVEPTRIRDAGIGSNVDHFLALIGANRWHSQSRYWKAWLRINLAVRCDHDPFVPLGKAISEPRNRYLIDFTHGSLDDISSYISSI